jgi:hypothetical protein
MIALSFVELFFGFAGTATMYSFKILLWSSLCNLMDMSKYGVFAVAQC